MSNSEEKAKSYQSRFCSQARITRLQFDPCTENKQKNHHHQQQQTLSKMKKTKKEDAGQVCLATGLSTCGRGMRQSPQGLSNTLMTTFFCY